MPSGTDPNGANMDQQAFESHPVWTNLADLESLLKDADAQGNAVVEGQLKDLRYVAALLRSHAAPSDTEPYSSAGLGGLNQQLTQAVQELRNYNSNLNPAHVTNAWQAGDQALYQSGMLPVAQLKGGAAAQANKFYKELSETAGKTINGLQARNAELTAELEGSVRSTV